MKNFMLDQTTWGAIALTKTSGYIAAAAIFSYLNIPSEQFWILATLMLIDFATWVGKQFRIDRKEIKSHLAWLGLMKKTATLMSVLSIALILKGIWIDDSKYVTSVLGIFIMAEGYSTIQNVYAIRTGKILPEFDVLSLVIKTIWEFFRDRIESTIKSSLPSDKK